MCKETDTDSTLWELIQHSYLNTRCMRQDMWPTHLEETCCGSKGSLCILVHIVFAERRGLPLTRKNERQGRVQSSVDFCSRAQVVPLIMPANQYGGPGFTPGQVPLLPSFVPG